MGWSAADNRQRRNHGEDERDPLTTTLAGVKIRRLTTQLSDGALTSQHAGAPALVCACGSTARGRALYAKRRSLQRRVRRRPQIQASLQFEHEAFPLHPLILVSSDQRVNLIGAGTMMPAQFQRRNARLYLWSAPGQEKGVDDPSRL